MDAPHTTGGHGDGTTVQGSEGGGHDAGDHGASHAHAHVHPQTQSHDWWSILRATLGTACALLMFAAIAYLVTSLVKVHTLEGQINTLNAQLREAAEKKAEKGDVAHLEAKIEDRAKTTDAHLKELSEKKAEKSDAANLELKIEEKADHSLVKSQLESQLAEIGGLRQTAADQNAKYNNAVGKYDTLLSKYEAEIATLRGQVGLLIEKVAKLEATTNGHCEDVKQLRDVRGEKVATELAAIRERLASVEAALKKKD